MKLCVNLKSNHTRTSFKKYKETLDDFLQKPCENIQVFVPSNAFCEGVLHFTQGAQNFYPAQNGAFTGEITAAQLEEFSINTVLIGHSERRALGEDEDLLKKKLDFAMEKNWNVVFCIGESKECFKAGKSLEYINSQIKQLELSYNKLVIAYEPIYSIGSGIAANYEDVARVVAFLRQGYKGGLLYGGSVNLSNIEVFKGLVDGYLIGSAGVDVGAFIEIIKRN